MKLSQTKLNLIKIVKLRSFWVKLFEFRFTNVSESGTSSDTLEYKNKKMFNIKMFKKRLELIKLEQIKLS